jgi:hypothetical protein
LLAQIAALAFGALQTIEQAAHAKTGLPSAPTLRPASRHARFARVLTSLTSGFGFTMGRNADRKR